MAQTKPYVRIQSNENICVVPGLHHQDVTNPDAHVPDRLKINALWPKMTVLIRQGAGVYPAEIATWETVKALANDKVLTIGEYLDSASEAEQKVADNLKLAREEIERIKKAEQAKSLADLAK